MQISLGIRLRSGTGFKVAVNCQRLMAIVKHLSSELVELESLKQDSNNQLTIRSGESKFKLKCWDEDDVALFALPSSEQQPVHLDVGSFSRALKKVRPAASNDPARAALNSVMLELVGNHCTLFSTDGRRLAFSRLTQQNPDEVILKVTYPYYLWMHCLQCSLSQPRSQLIRVIGMPSFSYPSHWMKVSVRR